MMKTQSLNLGELMDRVLKSGTITSTDGMQLLQTARNLEYPLSPEDQHKVKRIYDRLQMGLVRVVD